MEMILRRAGVQLYPEYVPEIVTIYIPNNEQEKHIVRLTEKFDDTLEELRQIIRDLAQRVDELTQKLEYTAPPSEQGVELVVKPIPREMNDLARLFISESGALETLLFLAEKGASNIDLLVTEVVSEKKILEIISSLSRHDLIKVSNNTVTITSKATNMITKILKYQRNEEN